MIRLYPVIILFILFGYFVCGDPPRPDDSVIPCFWLYPFCFIPDNSLSLYDSIIPFLALARRVEMEIAECA